MKIGELPKPVNAAKADWLPGTHWLGFTPVDSSGEARERCRATVNAQMSSGYVLEYATRKFGDPNPGFESSARYIEEREAHKALAGRLIAVHRLRPSPLPLVEILGESEFNRLQDMWAEGGKRYRWSVAFPIVESYSIQDQPFANSVLDAESMQRLFGHPSATLRPLIDDERAQIADLVIEPKTTANIWIGIADEARMAEQSDVPRRTQALIDQDLAGSTMEGMTEEQKRQVRMRAAWLADRFIRQRVKNKSLYCDECGFDPTTKINGADVHPRSLLDVHHKCPLEEGIRLTTLADFSLLCPTCHRFIHALVRAEKRASA